MLRCPARAGSGAGKLEAAGERRNAHPRRPYPFALHRFSGPDSFLRLRIGRSYARQNVHTPESMHRSLTGLALACALAAAAPVAAQDTAPAPGPGSEEVNLHPGDAVRVQIWRENDLNGEFPVDQRGRVTFPLLGEIQVTGMPILALRDTLLNRYRQHLRNPSITITPLRRVNILGEVQRPGLYALDPTITLAGAIGIAGGATPNGNLGRIEVVRAGQVVPQRVSSLATLDFVQIRSGDQIVVQRRSWFDRNSTVVVSMLLSATSIIVTLVN